MSWMLSELHSGTQNSAYTDTYSTEYLCKNSTWCPGQSTSNNPNSTVQFMQIQDFTQFGIRDGTCGGGNQPSCTVSNYHLWDMSQRGPMNALAMFYMVKNPNLLFGYDPAGTIYNGFDDYYVWVRSGRTLAAPITASTCTKGCSIPLSGQLETKTCPGGETEGCPIRIGGVDVVGTTSYSGTTLTTQTQNAYDAIINNYSTGATIDYAVVRTSRRISRCIRPFHVRDIRPGQRHISWDPRFDVWLQHALHFKQLLHRWRMLLEER